MDQFELGWISLNQDGLAWIRMDQFGFNWIKLDVLLVTYYIVENNVDENNDNENFSNNPTGCPFFLKQLKIKSILGQLGKVRLGQVR